MLDKDVDAIFLQETYTTLDDNLKKRGDIPEYQNGGCIT